MTVHPEDANAYAQQLHHDLDAINRTLVELVVELRTIRGQLEPLTNGSRPVNVNVRGELGTYQP